jgi:hypothetical protein
MAIENGLLLDERSDVACICAIIIDRLQPYAHPRYVEKWTSKFRVPDKFWDKAVEEGFSRTVGAIVHEAIPSADPKDWYEATGSLVSRRTYIAQTVASILSEIPKNFCANV